MNVLIVGNSEINGALEQEMARQGIGVNVLPSLRDLIRLKSQPGSYAAVTKNGEIPAAGIIITEPPGLEDVVFGEGRALALTQDGLLEELEAADPAQKVVFLLDYHSETPEYLTAKALEVALYLAGKKRKVVFLSRFIKTSSTGGEQAYREARQAGITFIKYERVDCAFEDDVFSIRVFDGVFETELSTPFLVAAGDERVETREQIIRKLRLAKTNQGFVNGNKYFLNPVLTSRKGVFYFHPELGEREDAESVRKVLPSILAELQEIVRTPEPASHAVVDADKCAFCYSCYRVCPHAALEPDIESSAMKCTESACVACGTCAAICPGAAITIKNEEPDLNGTKPAAPQNGRCKVFCCENSAYPAFLSIADELGGDAAGLDIVKIPCGGRIGQDGIAAALAGYDKVLLAVCMDDACRHMVGDKRACQHAEKLAETMEKMQLPGKRVACVKASHAMKRVIAEQVRAFLQAADK